MEWWQLLIIIIVVLVFVDNIVGNLCRAYVMGMVKKGGRGKVGWRKNGKPYYGGG